MHYADQYWALVLFLKYSISLFEIMGQLHLSLKVTFLISYLKGEEILQISVQNWRSSLFAR